jgi:T5SS/PEP-CTERM-associated repeat protein
MRSPVSVAHMARLCAAVCSLVALALLPGGVAQAVVPQITVYGTTAASTAGATYSGGTIAVSSTTQLDDGATVTGNIVDNGTLLFNQSAGNLLTISSTISGTGTLTLMNSGTLRLTGTTGSVAIPSSGTRGLIPLNLTTNVNSGVLTGALSGTTQNTIFQLGVGGTGTLNIAGGLVTGTSWHIGAGSGGVGTVNVSSGTFAPRGGIVVGGTAAGATNGNGGSGTLTITGGLVGDTAFIQSSLSVASSIASGTGSTGLVTITGGTLGAAAIYIGDVGSGTMTLNSGYLKLSQGYIGNSSGAQGTVNLLGGTTANGSNFQVGGTGSGSLTINASLV